MSTLSFEWRIEELGIQDDRGRHLCVIWEIPLGTNEDPKVTQPIPCEAADAYVRARRNIRMREMHSLGGVYIFPSKIN